MSLHESDITNILVDNYLKPRQNKKISPAIFNLVYKIMDPHIQYDFPAWKKAVYSLYGVHPEKSCISFLNIPKEKNYCYNIYGEDKLIKLLKHKKITTPVAIKFNSLAGMRIKNNAPGNGIQLVDASNNGEHFIASQDLQLPKGWYYFIFKTKPTRTPLYFYIIGEKTNLLLSWLNQVSTWSAFKNKNSLQPIFSQVKHSTKSDTLEVVIYSAINQTVHLRWQHGNGITSIYKGKKTNISNIDKAMFGQIIATG